MGTKTYFNIKELLSLEGVLLKDGRKIQKEDLGLIQNAYLVTNADGIILELGQGRAPSSDENINLEQAVVLPTFVDSHTHLAYSGSRANEFEMRSEGKTYIDIARAGGGIISTVNATRKSSKQELINNSLKNLSRLKSFGVGFVEAKSGYGLDVETELRQLEAVVEIKKQYPYIISTFLGAHDIPPGTESKEKRKANYIELLINDLIPKVAKQKLAVFCDVFLEDGYYTREETKLILETAKKHGLIPKLHADEFTDQNGAELGVELGATSVDHLLFVSNKGIGALANSQTVATMLPGVSFNLSLPYAPAKKLIDAGACIAIASDLNPGSNPSPNFQLLINIAVNNYKISLAQAIAGACYGGAKALKVEKEFGSLTVGKKALFQAYNVSSYQEIFYSYGENKLRSLFVP